MIDAPEGGGACFGPVRAAAEGFMSSSARDAMLNIARTYERMADNLEKHLNPERRSDGLGN
jgi:hypothetical protein